MSRILQDVARNDDKGKIELVVKVPAQFCYISDKVVPWNYTSRTVTPEPQAVVEEKPEKSVNDIAGT